MSRRNGIQPVRLRRNSFHSRRWKSSAIRTVVEQLEARLLLASHTCSHDSDPAEETSVASFFAAGTIRASEAGSTFATATDLGQLGASRALGGSVGGADTSDMMRFTLASQAKVNLALSGLRSDIDMALYNSLGQRIGLSNRAGAASESISQTLSAGVYYIAVTPWRFASSSYVLTVGATPTQPVTPTTPTTPTAPTTPTSPTNPTTPSTPVTSFPDVANYGGSNEWNLNAINAPEAWAQGYKGAGAVVAVVDTGVDLNHPDLMSQLWVNADEIAANGIDDDHNGYIDDRSGWDFAAGDNNPDDGNGHGTHVAGTIAADDNGTGATGVAPDAKIMPVRVLGNDGSGSAASVAAGIRYAAQNGADIINLSLGGALSSVIQSAIQYAQQLNVLVVVAAGNESAATPSYPARFAATMANVISVGAYSSSGAIASFSNHVGTSGAVQVDAPGVSIYNTYIDGTYGRLSGTSMATPHVAGLAALALSANPNLTAIQLRTLIVNGANRAISGSDSRGGINAAITVALAASGQVTTSTAASSAVATLSTAQTVALGRFAMRSISDNPSPIEGTTDNSGIQRSAAPDQRRLAPAEIAESMIRARDRAITALMTTDNINFDRESDEAQADTTALADWLREETV